MITTVFIDVDNTLLDFNKSTEYAVSLLCREYNIKYSSDITDTFFKINSMLWQKLEQEKLDKEELHRIRWKLIFEELGIETDYASFEKDYRDKIANFPIPVDGSIEILQYLSEKYSVFAASNASLNQQKRRLEKAGMYQYIKDIYTSEQAGASKPSQEFFDYCLSKCGENDKSKIIIIGDSLRADISGGINAGIKTCWFNYDKREPSGNIRPTYTAEELQDIKKYL